LRNEKAGSGDSGTGQKGPGLGRGLGTDRSPLPTRTGHPEPIRESL